MGTGKWYADIRDVHSHIDHLARLDAAEELRQYAHGLAIELDAVAGVCQVLALACVVGGDGPATVLNAMLTEEQDAASDTPRPRRA